MIIFINVIRIIYNMTQFVKLYFLFFYIFVIAIFLFNNHNKKIKNPKYGNEFIYKDVDMRHPQSYEKNQ